jgi:hypothetical protein
MTEKTSNPDTYFRKALTKWIAKPFKEYGFYRHKTANIGRITNDSIFQFLNFQKEAYGDKTFTVNVAVRPLFIPHEHLSLQPGQRIGYLKYGYDKWWEFKSESSADFSFEEVNHIIFDSVLKWFNETRDTSGLINLYTDKKQENIIPTSLSWRYYDLGHLYAKNQQYDKALEAIEIALNYFSLHPYDWCKEACKKCETLINILNKGQSEVDDYLKNCEEFSRKNLGLLSE